MSAVNHQFRAVVRLAETFASASRILSGWVRVSSRSPTPNRSCERGRSSGKPPFCLTMINGRCAQRPVIRRRLADGSNRPEAGVQDGPYERAKTARKRTSAEGCATTERSGRKLGTRLFDPKPIALSVDDFQTF